MYVSVTIGLAGDDLTKDDFVRVKPAVEVGLEKMLEEKGNEYTRQVFVTSVDEGQVPGGARTRRTTTAGEEENFCRSLGGGGAVLEAVLEAALEAVEEAMEEAMEEAVLHSLHSLAATTSWSSSSCQ